MKYNILEYSSALGEICVCTEGELLRGLWFKGQRRYMQGITPEDVSLRESPAIIRAGDWLDRYFAGKKPDGRELEFSALKSPFEAALREVLLDIPYGKTVSYSEAAEKISGLIACSPHCFRAVGTALGKNPVSIIIPCHRVISRNGVGGYAGGIDRKLWLLRHEGIKI